MMANTRFRVGLVALAGALSCGGKDCCKDTGVCPDGGQMVVTQRMAQKVHYSVAGNSPGVCNTTDGVPFQVQPNRLYKFKATGVVRISFNTTSGPAGNGDPAPNNFPAPGISRHALIFNLGTTLYRLAGEEFPAAGIPGNGIEKDHYEFKVPVNLCFRVNDDNLKDNSGAYEVDVEEYERTIACGPASAPVKTPVETTTGPVNKCEPNSPCKATPDCPGGYSELTGVCLAGQRCYIEDKYCKCAGTDAQNCGNCVGGACKTNSDCAPNMQCRGSGNCAELASACSCQLIPGCNAPGCWAPGANGTLLQGCNTPSPPDCAQAGGECRNLKDCCAGMSLTCAIPTGSDIGKCRLSSDCRVKGEFCLSQYPGDCCSKKCTSGACE